MRLNKKDAVKRPALEENPVVGESSPQSAAESVINRALENNSDIGEGRTASAAAADLPPGESTKTIRISAENNGKLVMARKLGFSYNGLINAALAYYFEQKPHIFS